MSKTKAGLLNIGGVERETGIGKDTLRVWERRYGFPLPSRDERDGRFYSAAQVEQLRLIKRLLDTGMRPAKVVGLSVEELGGLLEQLPQNQTVHSEELLLLFRLIKANQAHELRIALSRSVLRQGLGDFLSKTLAPLNHMVGDAWMRGEMRIFEEHLYSEQVTIVLRSAIATVRDSNGSPRVLLTTLPSEAHSLGLLMVEATLSLSGAHCIMLGVETPINEIVLAANTHQVDVVALSFSAAMSAAQIKIGLTQMRNALPQEVAIWVGGSGVSRQLIDGVWLVKSLADLTEAVDAWPRK
jgi:DNA-binding transcriptional MerR regulator/methylmalonyl-CoA mutase cobalamin-binding subunit